MAELHVVTGKGGVGKTTTAAALAAALADSGGRVMLAEVEARPLPDVAGVRSRHVDARVALRDYVATHVRVGLAGALLDRLGLVDLAASIAPGLRDVLLLGALYSERDAYDAIVLDAPPTGRIGPFLGASAALGDAARLGPVHDQARRMTRWLRSEEVAVHLVTLPAQLPVTETLEAVDDLRGRGLRLRRLVVNRMPPAVPPGDATTLPPPARAYVEAARARREAALVWAARLDATGLPVDVVGERP